MFTVLISYSSSTCSWNYATNCNFFFWFSLITSGSALLNRPSGRNIGLVSNRDQARQKKSCRRSRKCKNHFLKTETNSFLLFGKTPEIFFHRSFSVRNRTGQKKNSSRNFVENQLETESGLKLSEDRPAGPGPKLILASPVSPKLKLFLRLGERKIRLNILTKFDSVISSRYLNILNNNL